MKRSPSPQTLKILYYWKQTAHKVCFSWPRATHNTVFYNYQSGNNQLTMLSSSFLLPHPSTSWPTVCKKCLHLREIRTCVSYHSSSHPQHTVLPSVSQSLVNLGGKSCPELNSTKGKRSRKQVLFLQDRGPPPASLWATLMVTAAMFSAMDPLLSLHRPCEHFWQWGGKR